MQKTINYAMVGLVALFTIISCKKEVNWNDQLRAKGNSCKLTSASIDLGFLGVYTIKYSYDVSGKLIKASSDDESQVYTYTAKKITSVLPDGETTELTLENGKAVASYNSDFISVNGTSVAVKRVYTYNSDGYLSSVKSFVDSELNSTAELGYIKGNLSEIMITYADGDTETITYEYSSQLAVNTYETSDPLSVIIDYMPGNYFGKYSKNVVVRSTSRSTKSSDVSISDYTYQLDAKGNTTYTTIKTVEKADDGTVLNETDTSYSFVYDCK